MKHWIKGNFATIGLWMAMMCSSLLGWGQTGKVMGTVSDGITGETLIQAAVMFGTSGFMTDFDGRYEAVLPYGTYTVNVSYVGYEPQRFQFTVDQVTERLDFNMTTIILQEAQVIADVAIERETPVAFSNIKPLQIQEELGSQPIPMILNTTPGVYATPTGSDNDGPSITIRGFKQRNVSVLVDGVPVNDMESGAVFWNNWFGLDLVTQTMQVQRGLGASKLALPAIGGTVNIVTQGIESARKTSVKQEVGSFGFTRTSIGHTSGRLSNGWGYTLSGSFQNRQGYFDQDYNQSFFYYVKVQKALGNHTLSLSATGSPSSNASRSYKQRIATYDREYARGLFRGNTNEYEALRQYAIGYDAIFNNDTLLASEEADAYANLNATYGYANVQAFEEHAASLDFIDTTGVIDYGLGYNVHWGELNGEVKYERENRYHKPLFSFRHNWRVTDRLYVSNMLYASYGYGGGTRLENALGAGDYTPIGQVDFEKFYASNTIGGIFGPPIDPSYSDSLLKSGRYLRKLYNNHYWYGALSTFRHETSEKVTLSGGLDLRTYQGEHYGEVYDLLGGDYCVDNRDANSASKMRQVGDKLGYHNDAFVRWAGVFGLFEYKGFLYNAFVNVSGVYQGYKAVDYFAPLDVNFNGNRYAQALSLDEMMLIDGTGAAEVHQQDDVTPFESGYIVDGDTLTGATAIRHGDAETERSTSGWKWIPGFTIKAGGNYNLSEYANAFVNLGYLNRTPVFRNVVDYENKFVGNTKNEIIQSLELGYSYSKHPWSFNVNGYWTIWNNRPLQSLLRFETVEGDIVRANVNSMSALHRGLEADGAIQLNSKWTLEGYASYGDWRWTSSEDSLVLLDDLTNLPYINQDGTVASVEYDAAGVSVGDAPQSSYSIALRYFHNKWYVKPRFTWFDRYYSDFDPFSLNGENSGRQSWQIPSYGQFEVHAGYNMDVGESNLDFRLSLFNVLNKTFIGNAQNNDAFGQWYFTDSDRNYAFTQNNFDAASSAVYMGYPFRTNLSVRVRF